MSEPALQSIPSAPAKPIPRLFHTELPFWKAMPKKLALKAAEVQEWAKTRLVKLPGWNQLERAAHVMTTPVRGLASGALHYVPGLERLDWMFEAQKVTSTHPVILAGSLTWAVWRGLHSTPYGHIGTDPLIFPVLAAISYYNPFLGAVSGFFFGIGDLAQKLVVNDIYGTAKWDPDYLWSLAGYTMSYSALVVAGMIPGLVGRTFQMIVRTVVHTTFGLFSAARAEGAERGTVGDGSYPLAELVASMAGAAVGGYAAMQIAPTLERPAFYLRPHPDAACHNLEENIYLLNRSTTVAESAAFGGPLLGALLTDAAPPPTTSSDRGGAAFMGPGPGEGRLRIGRLRERWAAEQRDIERAQTELDQMQAQLDNLPPARRDQLRADPQFRQMFERRLADVRNATNVQRLLEQQLQTEGVRTQTPIAPGPAPSAQTFADVGTTGQGAGFDAPPGVPTGEALASIATGAGRGATGPSPRFDIPPRAPTGGTAASSARTTGAGTTARGLGVDPRASDLSSKIEPSFRRASVLSGREDRITALDVLDRNRSQIFNSDGTFDRQKFEQLISKLRQQSATSTSASSATSAASSARPESAAMRWLDKLREPFTKSVEEEITPKSVLSELFSSSKEEFQAAQFAASAVRAGITLDQLAAALRRGNVTPSPGSRTEALLKQLSGSPEEFSATLRARKILDEEGHMAEGWRVALGLIAAPSPRAEFVLTDGEHAHVAEFYAGHEGVAALIRGEDEHTVIFPLKPEEITDAGKQWMEWETVAGAEPFSVELTREEFAATAAFLDAHRSEPHSDHFAIARLSEAMSRSLDHPDLRSLASLIKEHAPAALEPTAAQVPGGIDALAQRGWIEVSEGAAEIQPVFAGLIAEVAEMSPFLFNLVEMGGAASLLMIIRGRTGFWTIHSQLSDQHVQITRLDGAMAETLLLQELRDVLNAAQGIEAPPKHPEVQACSNCKEPLQKEAKFCANCGTRVEPIAKQVCSSCGAAQNPGAKFCTGCGNPLSS